MGEKTGIRWADASDNPIRVKGPDGKFGGFYCIKISPGCTNCYAASMVATGRFGEPIPYVAGPIAPELYLDEEMLAGWARKGNPKRRFVSSMTDLAGEFVPDEWFFKIMNAQLAAPNQTFLDLTKRASRMLELCVEWMESRGLVLAPRNIWLGFSAENQEWFEKRWPYILNLADRFGFVVWVSAEPLIGPIVLPPSFLSLGKKAWVVCGGESGANARPMQPQWARDLRDQCVEASVPFFFKQWGSLYPLSQRENTGVSPLIDSYTYNPNRWIELEGEKFERMDKYMAGHLLDGQEWSQFPE